MAVSGGLHLLAERQRQRAFEAMVAGAPGGVLVMEHDGLKGRYVRAGLWSRAPGGS
jgi:hypothetical protein